MPQPQQSQQPDPDPCVPPFITPGSSGCYYVDTTVVNFTTARSLCSDQGGRLVEIDSQEKQDEITEYLANNPILASSGYWMGATDEAEEGSYVWSTSGREVTFFYWEGGQPGPGATTMQRQDCLALNSKWYDVECGLTRGAICETGESRLTCQYIGQHSLF